MLDRAEAQRRCTRVCPRARQGAPGAQASEQPAPPAAVGELAGLYVEVGVQVFHIRHHLALVLEPAVLPNVGGGHRPRPVHCTAQVAVVLRCLEAKLEKQGANQGSRCGLLVPPPVQPSRMIQSATSTCSSCCTGCRFPASSGPPAVQGPPAGHPLACSLRALALSYSLALPLRSSAALTSQPRSCDAALHHRGDEEEGEQACGRSSRGMHAFRAQSWGGRWAGSMGRAHHSRRCG